MNPIDLEVLVSAISRKRRDSDLLEKARYDHGLRNSMTAFIRDAIEIFDLREEELFTKRSLPIKYKDDHGNTWSGVGKTPNWLASIPHDQWDAYKVEVNSPT